MTFDIQAKTHLLIKCCKCGEIKHHDEFANDSTNRKTGKSSTCKQCKSVYKKEYRKKPENIERQKGYTRKYNHKHKNNEYIEMRDQYSSIRKRVNKLIKILYVMERRKNRYEKRWAKTRICKKCGVEKQIEKFRIIHKNNDGSITRGGICNNCLYQDEKYKQRRQRLQRRYATPEHKEKRRQAFKRRSKTIEYKHRKRAIDIQRRHRKMYANELFTDKHVKYVLDQFDNKCFNCGSTDNLCIDHHYPLAAGNPLTIDNAVVLCSKCNSKKHTTFPEHFYSAIQLLMLDVCYNKANKPAMQCDITCYMCGKNIIDIKRKRKRYFCSIECEKKYHAYINRERNRKTNNIPSHKWRNTINYKQNNCDIENKTTKCA